jgi:TolB-like protein/DNA-binding SARP family transcriptional activator
LGVGPIVQIRLLGGFALALSNGSRPGRLGPKPQALLAVLAMSKGQPLARSRLAGLLWGERDEDAARHSLSQALTTVRGALGPTASDVVLADPEGLRLAKDRLRLDVHDFETAVRTGRRETLEDAFRLYRGEFLEGLEVREPGFEDWMLSERYRLGEVAADAFARLLDLQTTAGDTDAAVETARRLVALTPLDEKAHARLIQLYGAQGRKGLAEAHYARCSELLQRELGEAPGKELRAALTHARRRSPSESAGATPGPTSAPPDRRPDWPQHAKHRTRARWAAAAAMVLLIGMLAWTYHERSIGEVGEAGSYQSDPWNLPARPSIAVLPFENLSGDQAQTYFADGITNEIITDLSKFSTLFVIAANSSFRYKGRTAKVQDVARDLGVRYLLEGRLQRAGDTLRINVNLIDATTARQIWAERYERPTENVLVVQKEIAQSIVGAIGSGGGALRRCRTPADQAGARAGAASGAGGLTRRPGYSTAHLPARARGVLMRRSPRGNARRQALVAYVAERIPRNARLRGGFNEKRCWRRRRGDVGCAARLRTSCAARLRTRSAEFGQRRRATRRRFAGRPEDRPVQGG